MPFRGCLARRPILYHYQCNLSNRAPSSFRFKLFSATLSVIIVLAPDLFVALFYEAPERLKARTIRNKRLQGSRTRITHALHCAKPRTVIGPVDYKGPFGVASPGYPFCTTTGITLTTGHLQSFRFQLFSATLRAMIVMALISSA